MMWSMHANIILHRPAAESPDQQTRDLLEQIYKPMELGATLHSALKDTGYFPKYMINMIQLGEETGRLEEVLNSLSKYYDREDEIASGIKSAVAYPLVLSAVMIAVIVVMIAKVLPVFSQIYAELGSELAACRCRCHLSLYIIRKHKLCILCPVEKCSCISVIHNVI